MGLHQLMMSALGFNSGEMLKMKLYLAVLLLFAFNSSGYSQSALVINKSEMSPQSRALSADVQQNAQGLEMKSPGLITQCYQLAITEFQPGKNCVPDY